MNLSEIMRASPCLSSFKITAVPKQVVDPTLRQREKFSDALQLQIEALDCEVTGKKFAYTAMNRVKESGEVVERTMRFKRWWRKDGNRYLVVLRYGARALFKDAIIANSTDEVNKILEGMVDACKAGYLDKSLQAVRRATNASRAKKDG